MTKSLLLMAPLLCAAASAFHVGSPAASSVRSRTTFRVYAEAEPSPDAEADGEPAASGQDDDILNSPAFLSRKADVLRSDIEELEGQITEASAQLEEGKAEWEPQIEKLQKEVRSRMIYGGGCGSSLQCDCHPMLNWTLFITSGQV